MNTYGRIIFRWILLSGGVCDNWTRNVNFDRIRHVILRAALVTYTEDGGKKCVPNIYRLIPDHVLYIQENGSACLRSCVYVFVRMTKFVRRMCEIDNEFINVIMFNYLINIPTNTHTIYNFKNH